MNWIDKIPTRMLVVIAVAMALAPFVPEPHLLEKARMLINGTLTRPVDIFDVFWHLIPAILLAIQFVRRNSARDRG